MNLSKSRILFTAAAVFVSSGLFAVAPTDFKMKLPISIGTDAQTALGEKSAEDVPVLVRISEAGISGFSYGDLAADGSDLAFGVDDGSTITVYPHEIDTWNPDGESLVWVKVPVLSASTVFNMYYGNGVSGGAAASSTWSNYTGVWHFGEAKTLTDEQSAAWPTAKAAYANSTAAEGLEGYLSSDSSSGEEGRFGKCFRTNDAGCQTGNYNVGGVWVNDAGTDSPLDRGDTFTISGWFKHPTEKYYYDHIFYKRSQGDNKTDKANTMKFTGGFAIELSAKLLATPKFDPRGGNGTSKTGGAINAYNTWSYLTFVYEGTNCTVYENGVPEYTASGIAAATDNDAPLGIGTRPDIAYSGCVGDANWCGWIDEVRLNPTAASADYVAFEYAAMATDGFLSFADVVTMDPTMPKFSSTAVTPNATAGFDVSFVLAEGAGTLKAVLTDVADSQLSFESNFNGGEEISAAGDYSTTVTGMSVGHTYECAIVGESRNGTLVRAVVGSVHYGEIQIEKVNDADETDMSSGFFKVSLVDGTATVGSDITVSYTIGGTAVAGETYEAIEDSVVIPAGEFEALIEIKPIYSASVDANVNVTLTLDPGPYQIGDAAEATVVVKNSSVNPYVRYVSTTGDDANNGLTIGSAKATLQAAIGSLSEMVSSGESLTVYLCDGDYAFDSGADIATTVDIPVTVTSLSGDASKVRVTKAGSSKRIFHLNHAGAVVSGITIFGGTMVEGGAVYIDANGGTVADCVVSDCANNAWNADGAVYMKAGRVSRCRFTRNNYARNGSALYATGGVVENSLFFANTASGAGAVCINGEAVLANCTIVDNVGTSCGGVKMSSSKGKAVNCAIFGNTAPASVSGAVYSANGACFFGCAADLEIVGGTDCIVGEALFKDADKNDYHLTPASCCMDAGVEPSAYASYALDVDGNARVVGIIDIGCYEAQKTELDCSFTCSLDRLVIPATATFTAVVCGASDSVSGTWDFGDGSTAELGEMTVEHVYDRAGTYTVSLTVTSGATVSYVREALVKVAPNTMYVLYGNEGAAFPYDTEGTAAAKLADAVESAVDGVTIYVLPGETGVHIQTVAVTLDKAVRVLGSTGNPDDVVFENTILDADGHGIFVLNHPQAFLANVTMKNGSLRANNSYGADVRIRANGGTVSNCVINSAQAQHFSSHGAGAYLEAGLVTHTRFTGTFVSCPAYNADPTGMGVVAHLVGGGCKMENCLFEDIEIAPGVDGTSCGPVIGVAGGTLYNCTINGNCSCLPTTSTDAKFSLYNGGCGIYCSSKTAIVKNCAVANVTNAVGVLTPFAGNVLAFSNCAGDGDEVWGGAGSLRGSAEEFFKDVANRDYRPKTGGMLINAGTPVVLQSTVDFAGKQRVSGKSIDIGCFEGLCAGLSIILR